MLMTSITWYCDLLMVSHPGKRWLHPAGALGLSFRARAPDGLLLYRPSAIEGLEGKPDADDKHYLVLRLVDGKSFEGGGYIQLARLGLSFRARAPDGLLLYRPSAIEGQEGKPDTDDKHYLVLRMVDGKSS